MDNVIMAVYEPITAKNLLELGFKITVIHHDNALAQTLPTGVNSVVGSMIEQNVLLEAGIDSAQVFMALSTEDADNLNAGLIAKQLNPQIRVVIRMFNQNLAHRINQLYENFYCVSTSHSISPAFAFRLILPNYCGYFLHDDEYHVLQSFEINRESPYYNISGESLAEGSKVQHSRGEEEIFDPQEVIKDGDRILLAKRMSGKKEASGIFAQWVRAIKSRLDPIVTFIKEYMFQDTLFRVSAGLMTSLMITAIPFMHFSLGLSFVDAFYFLVTISTTIGFGDFNFMSFMDFQKIIGAMIMIVGALIMALITATVTNFFMSERLARTLAQFQIPRMNHFIACGLGRTGAQVLKILQKVGIPIVGIESDSNNQFLQELKELKIPVVQGNVQDITILERVNTRTAKAFLAITPDELINLEASLNCLDLNPKIRTIIRLEKMVSGLGGISESPSKLSSFFFISAALGANSIGIMEEQGNPFLIFTIDPERYPNLLNKALLEIATSYDITIIMHSTEWDYLRTLENKNLRSGEWAIGIARMESILALQQGKPLSVTSHQVLINFIPPGRKEDVANILQPMHTLGRSELLTLLNSLPCVALEKVSLAQARSVVNNLMKIGALAHAIKGQQSGVDNLLADLGL